MISGAFRFTGFALVLGVLWAGCSTTDGSRAVADGEAFMTNDLSYAPGEAVLLTLRNLYDQPIGYNLCTSELQRSVNDTWERVAEDRMCTMQLNVLDPGKVDTFSVTLPESLAAGTYRYSTGVQGLEHANEPPGQALTLSTSPFQVK